MKFNIKHLILTTILFLTITPKAYARSYCSNADMLNVKRDALKVTIDYELDKDPENVGLFNITINGLTEDLSIHEKVTNMYNDWNDTNETGKLTFQLTGDNYEFKIYYNMCSDKSIRTMQLNLPKYNYYADTPSCENISKEDLEVCDEWYQGDLDDETFNKIISDYNKKNEEQKKQEQQENTILNKIIKFLSNYYLYIIGVIILIVIITFIMINRKKKYSLE